MVIARRGWSQVVAERYDEHGLVGAAVEDARRDGYVPPPGVERAAARLREWLDEEGDAPAGAE